VYHTKGSSQRTDNPTDLMIDGNGFFVVSSDLEGLNRFYTRAGNFVTDRDGFLVTPQGFHVLDKDMKPVRINKAETSAPIQTTKITVSGNINDADDEYLSTFDVFDALGNQNTITAKFSDKYKTGGNIYRKVQFGVRNPVDTTDSNIYSFADDTDNTINIKSDVDGSGAITDGETSPSGTYAAGTFTEEDTDADVDNANSYYVKFDQNGNYVGLFNGTVDGSGNFTEGTEVIGANEAKMYLPTKGGTTKFSIAVDSNMFRQDNSATGESLLTHYAKESEVAVKPTDGQAGGSITSFSIASNGDISVVFSNGQRSIQQTLGLADFDNPAGLQKSGSNLFVDTPNSGSPKLGRPSGGSFGSLTPGALEMSNVDLAAEFTDMITTQRGFQANSRIITTSDEILQELVSLKR
jgi:flagellar hook protein FlgE